MSIIILLLVILATVFFFMKAIVVSTKYDLDAAGKAALTASLVVHFLRTFV